MRKMIFGVLVMMMIAGGVWYLTMPDYHVMYSYSVSYENMRNTELTVVVYHWLNTENIAKKIETEHNEINGVPSELTINMYYTKWQARKRRKPYKKIYINYDNTSEKKI